MYTVLVPMDGDEGRVMAQAEMVRSLPGTEEITVLVLSVFDSRERAETTVPTQLGANDGAIERLRDARLDLEEMTRAGDPVTEILDAASYVDADLIVMGGRKRSAIGSALFGSVSQDVLLEADRPVVITGGLDSSGESRS